MNRKQNMDLFIYSINGFLYFFNTIVCQLPCWALYVYVIMRKIRCLIDFTV